MASATGAVALVHRLDEGPLLADGAMGTLLYARGVPLDACFDDLNLQDPKIVQRSTGSTSPPAPISSRPTPSAPTASSSPSSARRPRADDQPRGASWRATPARARAATSSCSARSGRSGKHLAPLGTVTAEAEARAAFREQAEGLLEGGVDGFVAGDLRGPRRDRASPSRRSAAVDRPADRRPDGVHRRGRDVHRASRRPRSARALRGARRPVLGANCRVGPASSTTWWSGCRREAGAACRWPIQPNAGLPEPDRRAAHLPRVAGVFADYAGRMLEAAPDRGRLLRHDARSTSRAMRELGRRHAPVRGRTARRGGVRRRRTREAPALAGAAAEPTGSSRASSRREFLVTVELDPPRGPQLEKLVQGAKLLEGARRGDRGHQRRLAGPRADGRPAHGAPRARGHRLDINMHFTCRDRNLMGIQARPPGAHALGIRNILAMTGDPPRAGDYVNATAVFDVDSIGLMRDPRAG